MRSGGLLWSKTSADNTFNDADPEIMSGRSKGIRYAYEICDGANDALLCVGLGQVARRTTHSAS